MLDKINNGLTTYFKNGSAVRTFNAKERQELTLTPSVIATVVLSPSSPTSEPSLPSKAEGESSLEGSEASTVSSINDPAGQTHRLLWRSKEGMFSV